jgi:cation diffusion facilitator family transporter
VPEQITTGGLSTVPAESSVRKRDSSRRSVAVALCSAVVQTLALGGAAWITGSAAMFAQTAASAVDVAVQSFLLIGVHNSARVPDTSHPLGYGRDRYFWSLFAALGILAGGVFFAFDEALHEAIHPTLADSYAIGYAVLGLTIALDAVAFFVAMSSLRRQARSRRRSLRRQIVESSDPADATVVLSNAVQLVGGLLATGALVVEQLSRTATLDALASAVIGFMLIAVSIFLLQANRHLLLGRGASPAVLSEMNAVVAAQAGVVDVPDLIAVVVGPSSFIVDGDVTLDTSLDVPAAEATIAKAAAALRQRWPTVTYVYLTPVATARRRGGSPAR